jgi:outer membrane protein OmpA-like peptidoglycan-associated protein
MIRRRISTLGVAALFGALVLGTSAIGARPALTLSPPRVLTVTPRAVTLTPRVVSAAPARSAANTFNVNTDVLFAFDSSTLSPDAQAVLATVVNELHGVGSGAVSITGYTDSIGTPAYNSGLSERRAASVQAFLQAKVGNAKLSYRSRGLGEADPVAPNTLRGRADNPAGRRQNRRVVIKYTPGG